MLRCVALIALAFGSLSTARADVEIRAGVRVSAGELSTFHVAVEQHYGVSRDVVVRCRRDIPDDHLPVVFYLASRAKVEPRAVVELRLSGKSWFEISTHFGLSSDVFYVHVDGDYGPPYGRALGHFKKRSRLEWGAIRLVDADVVHLVQLRFLSAHYRCSPGAVIKAHTKGDGFLSLHGKVKLHSKSWQRAGVGKKATVKGSGKPTRQSPQARAGKPETKAVRGGPGKGPKGARGGGKGRRR